MQGWALGQGLSMQAIPMPRGGGGRRERKCYMKVSVFLLLKKKKNNKTAKKTQLKLQKATHCITVLRVVSFPNSCI